MKIGSEVTIHHKGLHQFGYRDITINGETSGLWAGTREIGVRTYLAIKAKFGNKVTLIWEDDVEYIELEEESNES